MSLRSDIPDSARKPEAEGDDDEEGGKKKKKTAPKKKVHISRYGLY
jgi:hypothetical protein